MLALRHTPNRINKAINQRRNELSLLRERGSPQRVVLDPTQISLQRLCGGEIPGRFVTRLAEARETAARRTLYGIQRQM